MCTFNNLADSSLRLTIARGDICTTSLQILISYSTTNLFKKMLQGLMGFAFSHALHIHCRNSHINKSSKENKITVP